MKRKISSLCLAVCLGLPVVVTSLTLTGCAGDKYNRSTGEYIDDKTLSNKVKNALEDNSEYKFDDVNVNAFKGTVQLSGFVNTADQKRKAFEIAQRVEGVKDVQNNVSVK